LKQHINVLKNFVYVLYGWGKWFEEVFGLNHDVMASFRLDMWPKSPNSEPSRVGITV